MLHKVFIQNKETIVNILYYGFPLKHISKLVNNVESLHVTMLNAEELINSNERQDFIVSFYNEITRKYKNERYFIIIDISSIQIAKFLGELIQKKTIVQKLVNGKNARHKLNS